MKAMWTAVALCGAMQAQPAFEAASLKGFQEGVRQRRPGLEGGPGTSDPGRIRYTGVSLRDLILIAYRARAFQISPADSKALDAKTFELIAQLPRGATPPQMRLMLQSLLAERFHLKLHRERKELSGYRLVVANGGPKLRPSVQPPPASEADGFDPFPPAPPNELEVREDGYPNVPPREASWTVVLRTGYARTHQLAASMEDFVGMLSNQLERPVADDTGLKGRYEFTISWMAGVPASAGGEAGPDLFAALRGQLGLQLEPAKIPVETIAIDYFERDPSGN
jgi:uncharacterized protein (TIGR03435 family)